MSDLEDRMDDLEQTVEQADYSLTDLAADFISYRRKSANEIEQIKKVLALATNPGAEDQEKFKMLREAYEKYEFTKKLVLGTDDD
jgi:hypothetical protein